MSFIRRSFCGICNRLRSYSRRANNTLPAAFVQSKYQRSTVAATKDTSTSDPLPFDKIPGPKGIYQLSFLGGLLQFKPFTKYGIKDITKLIEDYHQKYGDIYRMRVGTEWVVYLFNPDDIMSTYRQDGKYPHRATFDINLIYTKRNNRVPSLVDLNDEAWHQVRQPTQQKMLRPMAVANYVPIINGVADDFMNILQSMDKMEDTRLLMMQYATESVGMLCFNKRLHSLDSSASGPFQASMTDIRDLFELFGDAVFHVIKPYRWFRTPFYRRYEAAVERLFSMADKEINEAIVAINSETSKNTEEDDEKDPNLLKDLLSDPRLTKEQTSRVLLDLFFAGIDSTSNSMTFLLYQLAKHPEIQEKLHEELNAIIPEDGRLVGSMIGKMKYLHACVKESMRLVSPIILGSSRKLPNDVVLGGYKIPKETLVFTCSMFSSVDERNFERAKEYIPERWLRDESGKRNFHPFSTLPFGFGPRSCIGQRFAEQEIYIAIAKMVRNFRFKLVPGHEEIQYVYKTFATTEKPLPLLVEKRSL